MSSRNAILASLRAAQRTPTSLPDVPMFDAGLPPALDRFKESFAQMGGIWAEMSADGDIDVLIRARFPDAKVICSAVPEVAGTQRIEGVRDPHELNDVDVGVVLTRLGID
jgi:L-lactate dehydrogenase complex protein LldG